MSQEDEDKVMKAFDTITEHSYLGFNFRFILRTVPEAFEAAEKLAKLLDEHGRAYLDAKQSS